MRCLVGTISEGVSEGDWGERGKGQTDFGVEQFRKGGFFVLRWIGSLVNVMGKKEGLTYSLNQDFADPNAPAYFAKSRFHCLVSQVSSGVDGINE